MLIFLAHSNTYFLLGDKNLWPSLTQEFNVADIIILKIKQYIVHLIGLITQTDLKSTSF